jgi:L-rhamnose mutarotase
MKKLFFKQNLVLLAACLMIATAMRPLAAFTQNDERVFYLIAYMKVKPEKFNEYVKMKTEVWKLVHKERIRQGKGTGWYMYSVHFPGGTKADYDFVTINQVKGWKSIETMWDGTYDIAKKVLTKEQLAVFEKTESYRDIAFEEIWVFNDGVFKSADGPPSKYQFVNFMKVPAGKWQDYMNMEKKLARPVHQEHIKAGGRAGWGLYIMWLPGGDNRPYQAGTIDFYDKWEDMGAENTGDIWKKVHPGKSNESIMNEIITSRNLVKKELRVLVDYVR